MCLTLRADANAPLNRTNIRWKLIRVTADGKNMAPFREFEYKKGIFNTAELVRYGHDYGFHVFVSREDARKNIPGARGYYMCGTTDRIVAKKVKVSGFLASGNWEWNGVNSRSETWTKLRVL